MAALYVHVSSQSPGERAEVLRASLGESNMTMVVRFMAGLTKFQSQEDDIQSIIVSAFQKEDIEKLVESFHWLFEVHDPDLIKKCMGNTEWKFELFLNTLDPFDFYVLGYCIANSRQPWNLELLLSHINAEFIEMLTVVEQGKAFDYIKSIDLRCDNNTLGDQGAVHVHVHAYSTCEAN